MKVDRSINMKVTAKCGVRRENISNDRGATSWDVIAVSFDVLIR